MVVRRVSLRRLVKSVPSTTYATHGLYVYPAKFIPQIVRYVLERYSEPGGWVFDPFAGSGTVAVEASLTGRNCILWDLNPILHLLVKASTYTEPISLRDFQVDFDYGEPFKPAWVGALRWHPVEFYKALTHVWGYWHRVVDVRLKPVVAVPLLKLTKYLSYMDETLPKLWRAKRARLKIEGLLKTNWRAAMERRYWSHARAVLEKIRDYQRRRQFDVEIVVEASDEKVFTGERVIVDSTRRRLGRGVDVMLTSPPYMHAHEYIRSLKLELAWLGFSEGFVASLMRHEVPYNSSFGEGYISSRTYEDVKKQVAGLGRPEIVNHYKAYFNSLAYFLNNNHDKVGSVIALVVGRTKTGDIRIPIDVILQEHLEYLGWEHVETLVDSIPSKRLPKKFKYERIPDEYIVIMRRRR